MIATRIPASWYATDEPRQFDAGDGTHVRPTLSWDTDVLDGSAEDCEAVQLELDGVGMLTIDPTDLLEALTVLARQRSSTPATMVSTLRRQLAVQSDEGREES